MKQANHPPLAEASSNLHERTHPMWPQDPAVPFGQKSIAGVNKSITNVHVAQSLLGTLKLLEKLEIPRDNHCFSLRGALHIDCCFLRDGVEDRVMLVIYYYFLF